jgi:SAM-dependent methyltransferase
MEHSRSTLPYIDRHKARGPDYDETFSPELNPYRAMMWRLEQEALDATLRDHLASGRVSLLDFACGTGRILGHFHGQVASATGVDVSPSMMEVARKAAPNAELIEADLSQKDTLGERSFDLITAFRFFPNAEPELRRSVLVVLARHLAPNGLLVFNNHKNRNSLTRRISRLLGRAITRGTMSHEEVEALLASAGLRIQTMVPLGTLPLSDRHLLLPVRLLERLERWFSRVPSLSGLAQNVIYVCVHSGPPAGSRA